MLQTQVLQDQVLQAQVLQIEVRLVLRSGPDVLRSGADLRRSDVRRSCRVLQLTSSRQLLNTLPPGCRPLVGSPV
ncbi:MAG: hypothetical protein ACT4QC_04700 [Planctomycetaceae bacterium]